jgi:hypothetical protein
MKRAAQQEKEQGPVAETIPGIMASTEPPSSVEEYVLKASEFMDIGYFVKYLGWARAAVGGAKAVIGANAGTAVHQTLGPLSADTLPTEVARIRLGDPSALMRMSRRTLHNIHREELRPAGRGGILVLRDESASMISGYEPLHHHAVTLEMAIAHAAYEEGRKVISIPWAARAARGPFHYGVDHHPWMHLGRMMRGGGTMLDRAMMKVDQVVKRGDDVLVITDGRIEYCQEADEAAARIKAKWGTRFWVLTVGDKDNADNAPWADGTFQASTFGEEGAAEAVRAIFSSTKTMGRTPI